MVTKFFGTVFNRRGGKSFLFPQPLFFVCSILVVEVTAANLVVSALDLLPRGLFEVVEAELLARTHGAVEGRAREADTTGLHVEVRGAASAGRVVVHTSTDNRGAGGNLQHLPVGGVGASDALRRADGDVIFALTAALLAFGAEDGSAIFRAVPNGKVRVFLVEVPSHAGATDHTRVVLGGVAGGISILGQLNALEELGLVAGVLHATEALTERNGGVGAAGNVALIARAVVEDEIATAVVLGEDGNGEESNENDSAHF
jgi:hypothetical protein